MSSGVTHEWRSGRTEALVSIVTQRLETECIALRGTRRSPTNLVVEVKRSHGDADEPQCHALLGVAEMWRADRDDVEILDLRKSGRSDTSSALRCLDRDPPKRVIDIKAGLDMNGIQRLTDERVSPRPPMTCPKPNLRTDG